MRKSSLVLLLAMTFVLMSVAAGFSAHVIDGACKQLCTKCWDYDLHIYMPDENDPNQAGDVVSLCPMIDFESSLGYCYNLPTAACGEDWFNNAPGIIFDICECKDETGAAIVFDPEASYGIRLEITSPVRGVYFTDTNDSSCEVDGGGESCGTGASSIYVSQAGKTRNEGTFCPPACEGTTYEFTYVPTFADDGAVLYDSANDTGSCDWDPGDDQFFARTVQTDCYQTFVSSNADYYMIDMPTMVWDPRYVNQGDELTIKVSIIDDEDKPCTSCREVCSCNVLVGIFGCELGADHCTLCFPYFTALDQLDWWNGVALTNSGAEDANVVMTFTAGGESVNVDLEVDALSVGVFALSQLDLSALAGKGAIYAQAVGTVPNLTGGTTAAELNGFAIMGDFTQAYGYLAKPGACGCETCVYE